MSILLIDTSYLNAFSVAVFDRNNLYSVSLVNSEISFSDFWVELEDMFKKKNLERGKIDVIGVSVGPGPFTSLRNGVSIARTISQTTSAKIISFSLVEVVYRIFLSRKPIILFDGRAGKFLVKHPNLESMELIRVDKIREVLNPDDLVVSIGCREMIERSGVASLNFDYLPMDMILNAVVKKFNNGEFSNYSEVLPIYHKNFK